MNSGIRRVWSQYIHDLSGVPGAGALVRVIVAARSVAMLDEHQNAARAPFHSRDNAERTTDGARARDCNHRSFLTSELIPHYNNNTPRTVQQFMLCSNHTVNVA